MPFMSQQRLIRYDLTCVARLLRNNREVLQFANQNLSMSNIWAIGNETNLPSQNSILRADISKIRKNVVACNGQAKRQKLMLCSELFSSRRNI